MTITASQLPMLAAAAVLGGGLFLLTMRRPAWGCAALAIGIPLTGGLTRGAAIPLLRISEALLAVVVLALIVRMLPRREHRRFTFLDIILLAYCLGSVLIPTAVILVGGLSADLDAWRALVSPLQYLAMYLLFSRADIDERDRRLVLNLAMLASLPMAVVALLQYTDFHGARELIENYYPSTVPGTDDTAIYRPTGLMGHYSALGAYGLINFTIALALAAVRHPGFKWPWLTLVAMVNLLTMGAAQTYAPVIALPLVLVAVIVYARRIPWRILAPGPVVAIPLLAVFWTSITARLQQQILGGGSNGIDSISTRVEYWQGFFIPGYLAHGFWMGTGTMMPPEVPVPLYSAVDNGYLYQLLRAGIPGLALLLLMMGGILATGWMCRHSPDPSRRALGAIATATILAVAMVDWTSEYLTFTTVSQELWMLIGMMAAATGAGAIVREPGFVEVGRRPPSPLVRARRAASGAAGRLLAARGGLVGSSALLFFGNGAARLVSLLFSIVAARLLSPTGYGQLAYALVVANVASVLLINAPTGLTRYLARHHRDRHLQEAYLSNWVVAILGVVVLSLAVAALIAPLLGLHGGMVLGTLAVILGVGAMQTYIQILTGLERFARMTLFWLGANVVQLIAVLDAALLGFRDPAVFLACYGLSGVLALVVFQLIDPLGLRVSRRAINRERMGVVWRYTLPLLFANAFVTVWLGCDLVLVERMRTATEGGVYASAKTLGQALNLAPQAIATAVLPGMSALSSRAAGAYLKRAIALIVAVQAPAVLVVALIGGPIAAFVFGGEYARAGNVLPLVATGMGLYGVFSVVESAWLGLGRTLISTIAAFLGMTCTLGLGLVLVPSMGGVGAGIAFAAGGLVAVCVLLGRVVVALLGLGRHRGVGHVEDRPATSSAVGS